MSSLECFYDSSSPPTVDCMNQKKKYTFAATGGQIEKKTRDGIVFTIIST